MASIQESGFQFTPIIPQATTEPVLRGLQWGQSPIQIKPTAGWDIKASPGISDNILTGINAIRAEYKDKKASDLSAAQLKQKQQDAKGKQDFEKSKFEETKRHNLVDEKLALARIKTVLPKVTPENKADEEGAGENPDQQSDSTAPTEDAAASATWTPPVSNSAAGTFETKGQRQSREMAQQRADRAAQTPKSNSPEPALPVPSELGAGVVPDAQSLALMSRPTGTSQTAQSQASQPMSSPVSENGPKPFKYFEHYKDAAKYMDSQENNPDWRAEEMPKWNKDKGKFEIPWKRITGEAEEKANADKEKSDKAQSDKAIKIAKLSNAAANSVNAYPDVKAFISPNGFHQTIVPFINAYESTIKHPNAAGTADVDLIDAYARAMSGGKPTEAQIHLLQQASRLMDKFITSGKKLTEGAILSDAQREQMVRVMLESHNAAADRANSVYDVARRRMIKQGVTDEDYLPQPHFAKAELKKDAKSRLDSENAALAQVVHKWGEMKKAGQDTTEIEAEARKRKQEIVKENEEINKEKGPIVGFDKLKAPNQGFLGGGGMMLMQQDPYSDTSK